MQWYYLSDTHERIEVSEAQFAALAARGLLRPATPVWRKGMADWAACGEVKPELFVAGIVRDSDRFSSAAESAAVHGTVIGLARALARYNVWLRIWAVVLLVAATATFAGLAWQLWIIIDIGVEGLYKGWSPPTWLSEHGWLLWLALLLQAVVMVLNGLSGWLLLRAAARAKRAGESGNELVLGSALSDAGRFFILTVAVFLLSFVSTLSVILWLGWDRAFAPPPAPEEKHVVV